MGSIRASGSRSSRTVCTRTPEGVPLRRVRGRAAPARPRVITVASDGDDVLPAFELPIRAMREMRFVMARPDRAVLAKPSPTSMSSTSSSLLAVLCSPRRGSSSSSAGRRSLPRPAGECPPQRGIHSAWLNDGIYRVLVNRFYNKVDAVVCPTAFAEQRLRDHHLTTPTAVISNGVPPDVARAMAAIPPKRGPRTGPFFILAVGRFAAEKRQDVIIEAIRRSRHRDDIRLVLSGWGPVRPNSGDSLPLSRTARRSAFSRARRSSSTIERPTSSFTPARSSSRECPCSNR